MIRCAVIGFGKMGLIRAGSIRKSSRSTLIGAFDIKDVSGLLEVGEQQFESVDQLFGADCDAVFICGYVSDAAQLVTAALRAGKHVFCEKPPAMAVRDLRSVRVALNLGSRVLKYGFNHRYHYSVIEARRRIERGDIGEPLFVRGIYGKAGSLDFEKNWRNYKKYSGGGILLDQGIHMIDLIRYLLCKEVRVLAANVKTTRWNIECEDNAMLLMESEDGSVMISMHSSATQWDHRFSLEIYGTTGAIHMNGILSATMSYSPEVFTVFNNNASELTQVMGKPAKESQQFDVDDSWRFELEEFETCVLNHTTPMNGSLDDAIAALEVVEAAYACAQKGGYGIN